MSNAEAALIKAYLRTYTQAAVAREFGLSRSVVSHIATGKTYKNVEALDEVPPIEGLPRNNLDYSDRLDVEILVNRGMTPKEIAERLDLDRNAVMRVIGTVRFGSW